MSVYETLLHGVVKFSPFPRWRTRPSGLGKLRSGGTLICRIVSADDRAEWTIGSYTRKNQSVRVHSHFSCTSDVVHLQPYARWMHKRAAFS